MSKYGFLLSGNAQKVKQQKCYPHSFDCFIFNDIYKCLGCLVNVFTLDILYIMEGYIHYTQHQRMCKYLRLTLPSQ